jgi:hypothetical protein
MKKTKEKPQLQEALQEEKKLPPEKWNFDRFQEFVRLEDNQNLGLESVTLDEFVQSWNQYKAYWSKNHDEFYQKCNADFSLVEKRVMRDRLLIFQGKDYVGYINGDNEKGTFGVEDLLEKTGYHV